MLLVACGNVPLAPVPEEAPLFRRIDARVGVVYASMVRTSVFAHPLARMEIGKASVARFEQVFAAMFVQAVELPDWPAWREAGTELDGVIELQRIDVEFQLGNDVGGPYLELLYGRSAARPDVIGIAYRLCLYEPGGVEIQCWSPSARVSHQRGPGDCLDMRACAAPQTEAAMREAIALFMVEAGNDPRLASWAARVRQRGARP
jgi:hypothetical protein